MRTGAAQYAPETPPESIAEAASFDPARIYHELLTTGCDWADKDAGAALLEETKKSVLSDLKLRSGEKSDAARETEALASYDYRTHIEAMVEARRQATQARVRYDATKTLAEARRTEQANFRNELSLVRQGAVG